MEATLVHLFRHNLWANLALIDACEAVDDAALDAPATAAFGTARETLVHILGAEQRYLWAVTRERPRRFLRETEPFPGFESLREHAQRSGEGLIGVAQADPYDVVLRGERGGEPYALPIWLFLVQAINHAHEHREQVKRALAEHGLDAPGLSGWEYGEAVRDSEG